MVENWRQQKMYIEQWDSRQFQDWVQSMYNQGQIKEIQQYQAGDSPPESLSLQFVPFSQGMLYVGSQELLEEDQIDLVKSLADSFSVAYARYEDFKRLEETKNRIEATLSELKATQSQLIQSEKMASLGELTAGIAHEIQNPLNFVKNFSEVNAELLEELKVERSKQKGDRDEKLEEEILNNIKNNEKKIIEHGNRADVIVKGMLQHSRTSTGEKELTDINALADEYLRLAYHGMRAKDKTFNAEYRLEKDPTLPRINVVPQDIGRVLLNLINNAFYAVSEASAKETAGSLPTGQAGLKLEAGSKEYIHKVIVSTKKLNDKIEIRVKDNGPGIPEQVRDKIFQPFFTTKPTGQGTGLGLSLSYDIITKGHSGEIRVESKESEGLPGRQTGTEFIIQLPIV
jgi:signal transduction histidine kinase